MMNVQIPVIVIDDTRVKRRGICECVEETPQLRLCVQAESVPDAIKQVEEVKRQQAQNPNLAGWLVLSDLLLDNGNGIDLGRSLLDFAPDLRIVIYTQSPSWTLAAEIFRREYTRRGTRRRSGKSPGLHGYALFKNMEPTYLEHIANMVVRRNETFIDNEVLTYLLKRLQGQRLT